MAKKKASLELSINAIVIVVLAFVLLGLGLGFIRSQFKNIGETTGQVQEQVKQQILEDLRTGDKKLSFPTDRVSIDKGGVKDLAIGIKNTLPAGNLNFLIDIYTSQKKGIGGEDSIKCDKEVLTVDDIEDAEISGDDCPVEDLEFFLEPGPFTLGAAEAEVYPISVTAGRSQGTFLVKISIYQQQTDPSTGEIADDLEVYAEKAFFVQIV